MPRVCLLLLLLLAACRQGAVLEPPRGSAAPAKPRPAGAAPTGPVPTVPPVSADAPIAFRSPEPDCADVRPIRVGGGVQRPEIIRRVDPDYPGDVRRMRLQGTGILELVINEKGRVCTVRVLKRLLPSIDQAMVDAVRQWTFRPAHLRGKPVAVAYVVTIRFDL